MSVVPPAEEIDLADSPSASPRQHPSCSLLSPFPTPSSPSTSTHANDRRPISSIQSEDVAGSIFDMYTSQESAHSDVTPMAACPPALDRLQGTADGCAALPDVVVGDLTLHPPFDSNRSSSAATLSDGGTSRESWSARSSVPPDSSTASPARGSSSTQPQPARVSTLQVRSNQLSVSQSTSVASSVGSLQAEGEEEDSFLVRSTYARLEVTGVTGDGWEDGVERTRERSKLGRQSVLFQHGSSADGLDEKEKRMRANLDRYGFFPSALSQRSESRIFAIPADSLSVPTSLAPATSRRSSLTSSSRAASPAPSTLSSPRESEGNKAKEVARIAKWDRMLVRQRKDAGGNVVSWGWASNRKDKVPGRVYKGIPDRWRASAWETLAENLASTEANSKGKQRAPTTDDLLREYATRVDQPSSFDIQIDLDVPRTVSGHVLFHTRYGLGQRALFHCLHVFSLKCDACQYCQGMGSIAANLLCYYSAEKTYVLLVRLHDHYGLHEIFSPGFPGMLEAFYVQERLIESMMPDVHTTLKKEMVSTSSFATKWYITLFSTTLPFQTQLRVWDAFFLEGPDLLIVVSLAIVWSFRENLAAPDASFETILSLLSSFFVPADDAAFMRWIQSTLALKGLRPKMAGWRREWQELLARGEAMDRLL